MALVPDDPVETIIQTARAEVMTEKAIRQVPDDVLGSEGDGMDKPSGENILFTIFSYVWKSDEVRAKYTEGAIDEGGVNSKKDA